MPPHLCSHTDVTLTAVCIAVNGKEKEVPPPATRELCCCCCSTGHYCNSPPPLLHPPSTFSPLLYAQNQRQTACPWERFCVSLEVYRKKWTRGQNMRSIINPMFSSLNFLLYRHTKNTKEKRVCLKLTICCGGTHLPPCAPHSLSKHPPCMYLKHPEHSDAGAEKEKEAKIGKCSVKSSHLCRCRGLRVGRRAGQLTIAQCPWSLQLRLLFSSKLSSMLNVWQK